MLRATTACNFSSLIWPAASAPAALASLLFEPLEPQIIGKTQCFATFLPFHASASSSSDSFSSDLLSSNLPLLSASALLCFSERSEPNLSCWDAPQFFTRWDASKAEQFETAVSSQLAMELMTAASRLVGSGW